MPDHICFSSPDGAIAVRIADDGVGALVAVSGTTVSRAVTCAITPEQMLALADWLRRHAPTGPV